MGVRVWSQEPGRPVEGRPCHDPTHRGRTLQVVPEVHLTVGWLKRRTSPLQVHPGSVCEDLS